MRVEEFVREPPELSVTMRMAVRRLVVPNGTGNAGAE